ncbi:MAG: efflux RND transporter permease subunit [candidate division WOR-3 bacterium]
MIKFSVRHPVTILMFIGVLLVLGAVSLSRMGLDLLPQMTYPAVTVVTRYENVAPEDIEQLVTKPIESVVSTVSGVKKVTSQSLEGISLVIVEFEWGTNLDFAAQEVRDKIGLIERYLPQDVQKPIVFKFDASMMPVARYVATSDRYTLTQLKKLLEDDIAPYLERVEGVATVDVLGGRDIEYWVEVDIPKLIEAGVSFSQISQMLQLNNFNFPSGKVDIRQKTLLIRTIGEYGGVKDLENQVVGFRKNGLPVFLKDIAKVYSTESERLGFAKSFKNEAIIVSVYKRSGANTVQVVQRVDKAISRLSKWYKDIKLEKGFDQSRFITKSASETINSGIIGAILAALMIFLFLIDLRPTVIISLAIPFSVIISFTILYFLGYSLNMMTLAGISLGVGMLVDAAVVVVENIFRHEELGEDRYSAAISGTEEVWTAISASTLTNIVVFLPLIYIGGLIGQFTKPLAVTVTITLLVSLLVAVTIIPVITSSYITQTVALKEMRKRYWFTPIREFYQKLLTNFVLPKRGLVLIGTIVLFLASIPLLKFIDKEFLPPMDMGTAVISIELPPATNLKETEHYVDQIIDIAKEYPEVQRVMATGGSSETGMMFGTSQGSNSATLLIRLVDASKRKKSAMQIANEILEKAPVYQGATVKSMDLVNILVFGGAGKPVEISLYGEDLEELSSLANRVAEEIGKIKGITGVEISLKKAKPELRMNILRDKAAYFGLTPIQIQRELQIALQGMTTTKLRLRGKDYNLVLKADTTYLKENVEKLYYFPILTPTGAVIPLKEIADFSYDYGPVQIDHENQSRVIKVLADIQGRKKSEVFTEIRDRLFKLSLPEGYSLQIKGEFEQVQDMIKNLGISILAAIVLVYMILAAQLESLKDPIIIMLTIPLAFIGVVLALWISGTTISVSSMVGALILVGVVVNQAIVMLTFYKELREKGVDPLEAVIQGSVVRLRPVLITNLTTIFGLIPMALSGHTEGGALRQPLAVAMIGGLTASTIMTFFVVPVIYAYFEKIKAKREE